jgi:hypothetical protein
MKNKKLAGRLLLLMLLAGSSLGLGNVKAAPAQWSEVARSSSVASACPVNCDLCVDILGIVICLNLPN